MMNDPVINSDLAEEKSGFRYFPFFNRKQPVFVLVLVGFIFYCTSLYNEYALDDGIVIHQNSHVLKGVVGIKDIMSKDLYHSFYERMNASDQLQGGRYHPLSVISFALEQEIIGTYRSGYYMQVADLNQNGKLDDQPVNYVTPAGKAANNYEYNNYQDSNHDGMAQAEECYSCWDLNKNFANDPAEDLNNDGVFNEVDCQVNGADIRHFNNIWLYVLAGVLLYLLFSNYILKNNQDMAFLAALVFMIHPVHSEIVANVTGRAEILSVIFIALTFLFAFKFIDDQKISSLLLAAGAFLLALLSKEFSTMLILLLPLAIYIFNKQKIEFVPLIVLSILFISTFCLLIFFKLRFPELAHPLLLIFPGALLFTGLALLTIRKKPVNRDLNLLMTGIFTFSLLYTGMRLTAVNIAPGVPDTELLNNPFLLATSQQAFATKVFVLLKYLILSFFPKNLVSDYSYNTIPYVNLTAPGFILSLVVNLALLSMGVLLSVKRHVMGFAIICYYAFLCLVSNFFFSLGLMMREGILFHSTIGVAIALGWLIIRGLDKLPSLSFSGKRSLLMFSLILITFLCGMKTWERNWDWKNDVTLFLKDVKTNPNSVLILGNAGARWIDLADTKEITGIITDEEDPEKFNDYNGTLKITDEELRASGFSTKREAALQKGIDYLKYAVKMHPSYVNGYLNLGLASYKMRRDRETIYYWKLAERLYPNNPYLLNYYQVYTNLLKERGAKAFNDGRFDKAVMDYTLWSIVTPKDAEAFYNLGGAYYNLQNFAMAKKSWERALRIKPDYTEVNDVMKLLNPPLIPNTK